MLQKVSMWLLIEASFLKVIFLTLMICFANGGGSCLFMVKSCLC